MKPDAATERVVLDALGAVLEAYRSRDADRLVALTAPDADVVLIGTGADERRVGAAELRLQAERDWSQSDSAAFELTWTSVSAAGVVAWVAGEGVVRVLAGGQEVVLPVRLTTVFEQRGGQWLLVHMHGSFPASEQGEGESWPTE